MLRAQVLPIRVLGIGRANLFLLIISIKVLLRILNDYHIISLQYHRRTIPRRIGRYNPQTVIGVKITVNRSRVVSNNERI